MNNRVMRAVPAGGGVPVAMGDERLRHRVVQAVAASPCSGAGGAGQPSKGRGGGPSRSARKPRCRLASHAAGAETAGKRANSSAALGSNAPPQQDAQALHLTILMPFNSGAAAGLEWPGPQCSIVAAAKPCSGKASISKHISAR